MSIFSGLFGGGSKKKFKQTPFTDTFTPQYLAGIEASGEGERNRIYSQYGNPNNPNDMGSVGGSIQSRLQGRGFLNSNLGQIGAPAAVSRARDQALGDLNSSLFAQRLAAMQAGTNSSINLFGINENSRNQFLARKLQQQNQTSSLLGNALGMGFSTAFGGSSPIAGGGMGLLGGFLGF